MKPEISEFSYGFALTNELVGWVALSAAPVFPSRSFTTGPELSDSERVVTCGYLGWLGKDALSQLDRQFAWGWCPEMPREATQVFEVPLPMLKTSRRKVARRLATKIGPVDPDFDQKGFMDDLWGDA